MKFEEYRDLYIQALQLDEDFKEINIPVEIQPGESSTDAFLRFLEQSGYVEVDNDFFRIIDRDAIREFDENLLKLLDAICISSSMAEMDRLEELGLAYTSVNDDGEIIYLLTDEGKRLFEE